MRVKIELVGKIFEAIEATYDTTRSVTEYKCLSSNENVRAIGAIGGDRYSLDVRMFVTEKELKKIHKVFNKNKVKELRVGLLSDEGVVTDVFIPECHMVSLSTICDCNEGVSVNITFTGETSPIVSKRINWEF